MGDLVDLRPAPATHDGGNYVLLTADLGHGDAVVFRVTPTGGVTVRGNAPMLDVAASMARAAEAWTVIMPQALFAIVEIREHGEIVPLDGTGPVYDRTDPE